jgi:hypothetical protein
MPRLPRPLVWLFRNRDTGRLTVVQWPNTPLAIYLIGRAIGIVLPSGSAVGTVVAAVASAALAVWAVLEMARGVNPFRRGLGSVVLLLLVVAALRHWGWLASSATP